MSLSPAHESSKRLDDMAREAGIQIARYQNPLDMTKTTTKSDPKTTTKLIQSMIENDPNGDDIKPTNNTFNNNNKSTTFQDIIQQSPKSDLHQLPSTTTTTPKSQPQSSIKQQPQSSTKSQQQTKPQQQPTKPQQQPTKPQQIKQQPIKSNQKLSTLEQLQKQPTKSALKSTPTTTTTTKSQQKQQPKRELPVQVPSTDNKSNNTKNTQQTPNINYNLPINNNDDEYTLEERKEKAAGFYELIETKLIPQLRHYQTRREKSARLLHELEQLLDSIRGLQLAQQAGTKTMECKVDLGCKVMADAKFVNNGKIIIDLGLGIFAEMSFQDAIEHLYKRCELLRPTLLHYENQCCLFSSRIKGMHEAIGVLTELSDQPEEREPLRDVWI